MKPFIPDNAVSITDRVKMFSIENGRYEKTAELASLFYKSAVQKHRDAILWDCADRAKLAILQDILPKQTIALFVWQDDLPAIMSFASADRLGNKICCPHFMTCLVPQEKTVELWTGVMHSLCFNYFEQMFFVIPAHFYGARKLVEAYGYKPHKLLGCCYMAKHTRYMDGYLYTMTYEEWQNAG